MQRFIESVERSLDSENWFAALFIALALPDICRSLERPNIGNGETGRWYKDWVSRYIEDKYINSSFEECKFYADDFWLYRCSCLHSGLDAENKKRMMKFNFTPPLSAAAEVHKNYVGDRLQLQIDIFCRDMVEAVRTWLQDMNGNHEVHERMGNLIAIDSSPLDGFISIT
ncbi:hypothetical protein [Serratia fonticola]|uniref:hypothetical protein n=1 Tax=Serratia fonticola TaxID=47917 RepID=UPI000938FFDB|nr:hypothetical protein [Serratia fonticola]OKP29398.1 hypothetical protein BSQ40_09250 [Serratia fonticola]